MKCFEFINLHSDVIRQVSYSSQLNSIISASESALTSDPYLPGVIITYLGDPNSQTVFKMNNVSFFHAKLIFLIFFYTKLFHFPSSWLPIMSSSNCIFVHNKQGTTCFALNKSSQTLATGETTTTFFWAYLPFFQLT